MSWAQLLIKVRKRKKIRNRYNQAPHLIQDTNGKVTTSQLSIFTNDFMVGKMEVRKCKVEKEKKVRKGS